ncbi:sulfite oxidase heme-binding subunit YedZ [Comamonas nitrativorans]|uniref:Protein-methionine-sulfoxide reductase heme-binding subunit MsrQ n=1 Tax=Comamonas nitrativorans TaxID=108437 RepID=A0ABV9GRM6_9BURK
MARPAPARLQALLLHRAAKPAVWCLCLAPLAWLLYALFTRQLGANPAEALLRSTGDWALRGLCLALAVTPLRQALGLPALARLRRLIGLFAFFYAAVHVLCYLWLDMGWQWALALDDLRQRPFILVGTLAALVLLTLALTSSHRAVQVLGAKSWQRLHHSVHAAAWLALLHFYWMRLGKNQWAEVAVYAAIVAALQWWRIRYRRVLARP